MHRMYTYGVPKIDLVNRRFGRLTVIRCLGKKPNRRFFWECLCNCGKTHVVDGHELKNGHTSSCGCLQYESMATRRITHGATRRGRRMPEYFIFHAAKKRCENPNDTKYKFYGGRGIEFRFTSFEQFMAELGRRPEGTSIDRINTYGHYEPGNVRWATTSEQIKNRRPMHGSRNG